MVLDSVVVSVPPPPAPVMLNQGGQRGVSGAPWRAGQDPPRSAQTAAPAPAAPACGRSEPAGRSTSHRLERGKLLSPALGEGAGGRLRGRGPTCPPLPTPRGFPFACVVSLRLPPAPCLTIGAERQAHIDQVHGALTHGAALDGEVVHAERVVQH